MAEPMEDDDFPPDLPKFNRNSYAMVNRCRQKLLPIQLEALESLRRWFDVHSQDGQIALVWMPTGSGKTGIICCLPYFLGTEGLQFVPGNVPIGRPRHSFDKPVLIISPNLNISDHLEEQMLRSHLAGSQRNFFLRYGIVNINEAQALRALPEGKKIESAAELNSPKSAYYLQGKEVIIANAQKFLKEETWEACLPNDMFKLVIVDEAHHHPAKTWKRIITKFRGHALVVFFTATPYRGDKKPVVEPPFAYELPLARAIGDRIIRNTKFVEVTGQPRGVIKFRTEDPEDRQKCHIFLTILEKVRDIQEAKDRETPLPNNIPHMAFAIAKDQVHANRVAELWNASWKDAPAITYTSETKNDLPEKLGKIRANQVRLVVVVDMLQEGFDHPPVSICAIMTNIGSPVKFVQFIGRGQRIARDSQGNLESDTISAHIVTHQNFQQAENYDKFRKDELLFVND